MRNPTQTITESGPRLSRKDVEDFQAKHNIVFPPPYSAFLLEYNGGRPELNAFPIQGLENNPEGSIKVFYAMRDPVKSSSLEWIYMIVRPSLPDNLIPIASDGGGDQICLRWSGQGEGQVVFWLFHDMPHKPDPDDVYLIADTFDEFFMNLRYSSLLNDMDIMFRMNDTDELVTLLSLGYDIEKTNECGRTLIEEAACFNRPQMIQILFEHGAKLKGSLQYALDNLEVFPEHQSSVDLLRRLSSIK